MDFTALKSAKESYDEAMEYAFENIMEVMDKAIENGIPYAIAECEISDEIAKAFSEKGYDVMIFSKVGYVPKTRVDFKDTTGKITKTDDLEALGVRLIDIVEE